jgi:hypothetical protein
VTLYDCKSLPGGISREKAQFDVRVLGLGFRYFIDCTRNEHHKTYTWMLDYSKTSDLDDNVGHWQVMQHPAKQGWSRVLYSTDVRLPAWMPGVVVNILTKTAILESTQWVKQVSQEKAAAVRAKAKTTTITTTTPQVVPGHAVARPSWLSGGGDGDGGGILSSLRTWGKRRSPQPQPQLEPVPEPEPAPVSVRGGLCGLVKGALDSAHGALECNSTTPRRRRTLAIVGGSVLGAVGAKAAFDRGMWWWGTPARRGGGGDDFIKMG